MIGAAFFIFMGLNDKDSLIQGAKRQMDLIPSSAMPEAIFKDGEQALVGEFTGERLFVQDPEKYQFIVSLLAERVGILRIAKLLKVSPGTVTAVRDRESVSIGIEKEGLARLCHQGAVLALEGVIEDLSDPARRKKVSTRDKAVTGAVLIDKGQLLSGEATMRMEVVEITAPEHEVFNNYLKSLKDAKTGLSGETPTQKDGAGALGTGPGVPGGPALEVGSDSESEGKKT